MQNNKIFNPIFNQNNMNNYQNQKPKELQQQKMQPQRKAEWQIMQQTPKII